MAKNGEHVEPTASKEQSNEKEYVQTYGKNENDDYGYYFYPSRSPGKVSDIQETGFFNRLKSREFWRLDYFPRDNFRCRHLVHTCLETSKSFIIS